MRSQKAAIDTWLRSDVVASYDELRADPSRAISSEQMRAHLADLQEQQRAEKRFIEEPTAPKWIQA